MRKLAQYISLFFLGLFIFPQINNALHYYIVDHTYHKYDFGENFYPNYKNHDCKVSTFKISKILLFDFEYIACKKQILYPENQNNWVNIFPQRIFLRNIFNRGPPTTV